MRPTLLLRPLLIASLIVLAPLAAAQPHDDEAYLSIEALVAWVLEENRGLAAARARADAAMHRVDPARSREDPMLGFGVAPRSTDRNIELSQRLLWPGTLEARGEVARYEARAADWSAHREQLELMAAAKSAYAEWYFVARAVEIHEQTTMLLDELIATSATQYAAGRAPQQDVLQAEIERAELETQGLSLSRQRTAARARINALLNRAPDTPLPPPAAFTMEYAASDPELLASLAFERHPELARLESEVAAASSRITVAQKAFFPDFQVLAGYHGLWEEADKRPMLGVAINVPFDRGKRRAALDHARAERRHAELSLENAEARLLAEVAQAQAAVVETAALIELYEQRLVPLASEYLAAALADYRSAAGPFANVIMAERRTLSAELMLERNRADYFERLAELERATGGPVHSFAAAQRGGH